jgi:hypothetical protein
MSFDQRMHIIYRYVPKKIQIKETLQQQGCCYLNIQAVFLDLVCRKGRTEEKYGKE